MIRRLIAFARNPAGWRTVTVIENELRDERGADMGAFVFRLQRDRRGRRRHLVATRGAARTTTAAYRLAAGRAFAERWTRTGEAPPPA